MGESTVMVARESMQPQLKKRFSILLAHGDRESSSDLTALTSVYHVGRNFENPLENVGRWHLSTNWFIN